MTVILLRQLEQKRNSRITQSMELKSAMKVERTKEDKLVIS